MLLPFAALLINLNLARKDESWVPARRALLWTAGLPLLALAGFFGALRHFCKAARRLRSGRPLGWPPRFVIASDAWTLCRAGNADADKFGIFRGNLRGLW